MEVIIPRVPSPEFNFDSTCSSPYAPSTPKRFGYFSAPTSPTRMSSFYQEFNEFNFNGAGAGGGGGISRRGGSAGSVIPYDWEETPGTPKSTTCQSKQEEQEEGESLEQEEESLDLAFEFEFSGQLDKAKASLSADELFDGGKIKPLKPPPRLQLTDETPFLKSPVSSPKSPIKKMIRQVFSPKSRRQIDPFAVAIEQSRRGSEKQQQQQPQERGRERGYSSISSSKSRKGSRSLSPFRTSSGLENQQQQQQQQYNAKPTSSNSNSKSSSRKWSFRDFLLFRSASEGRASERDPLRKYSLQSKRHEEVKNSSFRSIDSSGSGSGSSRRRGHVSAHEMHYKINRAVSEETKRKTSLPYRQGLFGWFRI